VIIKPWIMTVTALLSMAILGCGGLRYVEVSPDAGDFHPRRIAVLPAYTKVFEGAKGDVDRLVPEVLHEKKWFDDVVGGDAIGRRMESDGTFGEVVTDYVAKLTGLSFSDPALSERLGELTDTDAFLFVQVDYWNYTTVNDKKVAKVSLGIKMIEAKTGKILWTAGHHKISDYVIMKPDLPDVAKALIREMIGYMPH
jgi:hypothetical protein